MQAFFLYVIVNFHILSFVYGAGFSLSNPPPGFCTNSLNCTTSGYQCVSVNQTIPRATHSAQCTPPSVCAGRNYGYCPSFTSWPKLYQSISPICAFTTPLNCRNPSDSSSQNDTVDCFTLQVNGTSLYGIYSCVDYRLFRAGKLGLNKTEEIYQECKSTGTEGVCNQAGTCAPVDLFSMKYACLCNKGYNGSENSNCFHATSNNCNNFGQCGQGGSCDIASQTCQCDSGIIGDQCSKCDPTSTLTCNGHGTCNSNGNCTCEPGYSGAFCSSTTLSSQGSFISTGIWEIIFLATTFILFH